MQFTPTSLPGLWLIELERREDERGFLARTFCEKEFADHALNTRWPQCNPTLTKKRGMIRGDDPQVNTQWPIAEAFLSERDRLLPRLAELA